MRIDPASLQPHPTPPDPCRECGKTPSAADIENFLQGPGTTLQPEAARLAESGEARWCAACGEGMTAQIGRRYKPVSFAVRRDDEAAHLTGYWKAVWGDREEDHGTWVTATNQTGDRVELLIFDSEALHRICRGCGEPLDPDDDDAGPLECGACYRAADEEDVEPDEDAAPWRKVYRITILVETASNLPAVLDAARTANSALRDLGGLLDVESDEDHLRVAVEHVGEAAL